MFLKQFSIVSTFYLSHFKNDEVLLLNQLIFSNCFYVLGIQEALPLVSTGKIMNRDNVSENG
jgi:hypothetical protein